MHQQFVREVKNSKLSVLFIHGILGTPDHFKDFVKVVPEDVSVYNILLDGHGKKPKDLSKTSMKIWKEQVRATVEMLCNKYEEIVIVAHSMGTLFAVNGGIEFKDKIKALFLLSIPLAIDVKPLALKNSLKILFGLTEDENDKVLQAMKDGCSIDIDKKVWNYIGWVPRYAELFGEVAKTKEILPMLEIPCYIFQSKNDELVSVKSDAFFKTNPEIIYYLLEESGHFNYSTHDKEIMLKEFSGFINSILNNKKGISS